MACVRPFLLVVVASAWLWPPAVTVAGRRRPRPCGHRHPHAPRSGRRRRRGDCDELPARQGDVTASCGKRSPRLLVEIESAIDRLVKESPQLFNTLEEAGEQTGQYRVLDHGTLPRRPRRQPPLGRPLRRADARPSAPGREERQRLLRGVGRALASRFIRRTSYAYQATCEPAAFPVEPVEHIAYVRTAFLQLRVRAGHRASPAPGRRLPSAATATSTATPKQRNDDDVPAWIHGPAVEWELREGEDVIKVDGRLAVLEPLQQGASPHGRHGRLRLCATVLGKVGCLNGRVIP